MGQISNNILFPALKSHGYSIMDLKDIYDIQFFSIDKQTYSIFMPSYKNKKYDKFTLSKKALIYFHGNAEDLGTTIHWLAEMENILNVNIFANQYPGYGIYNDKKPSARIICEQALKLYMFVNKYLGFNHSDIIIVGRSMGSGPACHIAGNTPCQTLILISPFLSFKQRIVQKTIKPVSWLFPQKFPNDQNIRKTKARLLTIHGKKDDVISFKNAQQIRNIYSQQLKRTDGTFLFLEEVNHENFDIKKDIICPIKDFIDSDPQYNKNAQYVFSKIRPLICGK